LKDPSPEIAAFIAKNEAWQERERARHDPDGLWTNYRLMQVWDLLGLYFCGQEPYDDWIAPVPARDGAETRLTMTPVGPRRVAFDPYPFDAAPCRVQLTGKRLPSRRFDDVAAFQRAWFRADVVLLDFELERTMR
jgi:hypothetical protein